MPICNLVCGYNYMFCQCFTVVSTFISVLHINYLNPWAYITLHAIGKMTSISTHLCQFSFFSWGTMSTFSKVGGVESRGFHRVVAPMPGTNLPMWSMFCHNILIYSLRSVILQYFVAVLKLHKLYLGDLDGLFMPEMIKYQFYTGARKELGFNFLTAPPH